MRNLHILVVVLILFSYPVVTVWLTIAGFDTSLYNLALKGLIVVLCALAILIDHRARTSGIRQMWPLLAFFFLFGVRLVYDVTILGIVDFFQSPIYVYGYFFGLTFLPALMLTLRLQRDDLPVLHRMMMVGLVTANLSLLAFASTRDLNAQTAFAGRLEQVGEQAETAVLGPIMVGLTGAMLAAYGVGRVAIDRSLGVLGQLVHGGMVLIGGINILLSGSRGPALAFGVAFLIVFLTLVTSPFRRREVRARKVGWLYAGFAIIAVVFLLAFFKQDIFLFDRFDTMYHSQINAGQEERNFIYAQAWEDFLANPILGSSYLVSTGASSAHNFMLEALMATGAVGGMLFAFAILHGLARLARLLLGSGGAQGYVLALITVCLLVVGSTSGSVRETPELWAMLAVMTILGAKPAKARQPTHVSMRPRYV